MTMPLDAASLDFIRQLVLECTGVFLDNKDYLIESRLESLAISSQFKSATALLGQLRATSDRQLEHEVVESLLTHETMFFRDQHYFDCIIEKIFPELLTNDRDIRVWCAACSSGQEPYTLAMLLRERLASQQSRVQIFASDYSRHSLQQARAGLYSRAEVQRGLSSSRLSKHFTQVETRWQIDRTFLRVVDFREINLLGDWPEIGHLDVILLRNVLIYMPDEARNRIVRRVIQALHPGGYLILGASESLRDTSAGLTPVKHEQVTVYQRQS